MEFLSKDFLKQLMQLMNNQQHKLDRVMERLDTLHNIMEKQNQKQISLDDKLVEMTVKSEQENAKMTEQLQHALQEIVQPFSAIDFQEGCTPSSHKTTQPLQSLGAQIGDKLKSIDDRTIDTAHTCHQLISLSCKMEDRIIELADKSVEMKSFLTEMRSVKDLIKGQTNTELIWLNNQIDKKLSDISSAVRDIHRPTETKEEAVPVTGQVGKTGISQLSTNVCEKLMQAILDLDRKIVHINSSLSDLSKDLKTSLETILMTNKQFMIDSNCSKEQSLLTKDTLKSQLNKLFEEVQEQLETNRKTVVIDSETQVRRIISAVEKANENLRQLIQTEGDNNNKCRYELGNIHTLINSLSDSMQRHLTTVLDKTDCSEISMREQMEKLFAQTTANSQLENLITDLKDDLLKTKCETCAVTEKEAQIVRDLIQGPLMSLVKKVSNKLDTQCSRIVSAVKTATEDLRHLILKVGDNTSEYKVELKRLHSSVSFVSDRIQGSMKTVLEKIDLTEALIKGGNTTVIKQTEDLSTQSKMNKQLNNLTNDLKDYIYQTKREIFAVTEKEAQIVRDRIQEPLVSHGNYIFDFYVDNFKTLVRSGKCIHSLPWHINELRTCVTGCVVMSTNGEMEVYLLYGRHPGEVGLEPKSAKTLKVKATISDMKMKKLQPLDIGEATFSCSEAGVSWNGDCGNKIGLASCDELIERGYGEQEGYIRGALLMRYEVTVEGLPREYLIPGPKPNMGLYYKTPYYNSPFVTRRYINP